MMGFFTGSTINPVSAPPIFPGMAEAFGNVLGNWLYQATPGDPNSTTIYGADPFLSDRPGVAAIRNSMSTPIPQTSQAASAAWQPFDAGTMYLASNLGRGRAADLNTYGQNVMQYGNVGGYPGQLMNSMVNYGGAGQAPTTAMSNIAQFGTPYSTSPGGMGLNMALQYGAPSQAGQYVGNMANYGVSGQAGMPLQQMATGQPNAATAYLTPFLNGTAGGYTPNQIFQRPVFRNAGAGWQPAYRPF